MKISLFDIENWREIGMTLARNKTRTFLTAFGIFWGVAMLAILWGGAHGVEGMLRRQLAGMATNFGGIYSGRLTIPYKGYSKGMWWQLNDMDADNIRRITPYLDGLAPIYSRWDVQMSYNEKSKSVSLKGVNSDFHKIQSLVIHSGRLINDSDVAMNRKVAVVGKNVANEIFGSEDPVGKRIAVNGIYFTVVGVAGQKGEASFGGNVDTGVMMPITTLRRTFNVGNIIHYISFTVKPGHTPSELEPYIRRAIRMNHPMHPADNNAVRIEEMAEKFAMIDKLFVGFSLLALFVGAGSLMAGVIGVGNIMWIVVRERTQEIGIRRAIGARPRDITFQILAESALMTVVAGMAGIVLATIVLGIADIATSDPVNGKAGFELDFIQAIGIFVTFFVLGILAGVIPAIKAMRIKPVEAINTK